MAAAAMDSEEQLQSINLSTFLLDFVALDTIAREAQALLMQLQQLVVVVVVVVVESMAPFLLPKCVELLPKKKPPHLRISSKKPWEM
jgi:hypothetical protein